MTAKLEVARRWRKWWAAGMTHFASMCADALSDGHVEDARVYAARFRACRQRMLSAWARELAADQQVQVDWFGDDAS